VVNAGGPVGTAPTLVPVFFPSTTLKAELADFLAKWAASPYWNQMGADYGIGPANVAPPITMPEDPTPTVHLDSPFAPFDGPTPPGVLNGIDDNDIKALLAERVKNDAAEWGTADLKRMYVFFLPEATLINYKTDPGVLCSDGSGGYHSAGLVDGTPNLAYAIIPNCRYYLVDPAHGPKDSPYELGNLTAVTTHEVMEGLADLLISFGKPAYSATSKGFLEWEVTNAGGEIGDMCARGIGGVAGFTYQPPGFPYLLQRMWSNSSAAAGHDPCVPAPPGAYFNSAPVLPDVLTLPPQATPFGTEVSAHTVRIPVGQTVTVPVQLFSDGPTDGEWTVQAFDSTAMVAGLLPTNPDGTPQFGDRPKLTFRFDRDHGGNGDTLSLQITNEFGGGKGIGIFQLLSTLGTRSTVWNGGVADR
jgi:hypothetical protein